MTTVIAVCEAPFDFDLAKTLTERTVREAKPTQSLVWVAVKERLFIKWSDLTKVMRDLRVKPRQGHFDGKPGKPDAAAARNALHVVREWSKANPTDVVILLRDADDQPERRTGLEQARHTKPLDATVIISSRRS